MGWFAAGLGGVAGLSSFESSAVGADNCRVRYQAARCCTLRQFQAW